MLSSDQQAQEGNGGVDLGQLDITSDNISLAGLADQLDELAHGSLIDAVLDGGIKTQPCSYAKYIP